MNSKSQLDGQETDPASILLNKSIESRNRDSHHATLSRQEQNRESIFGVGASLRDPSAVSCVVLTPRQRNILQLLAQGYSSKQMAAELNVSVNTVNNHRAAVFIKLGVHSAAGALKWYWQARATS